MRLYEEITVELYFYGMCLHGLITHRTRSLIIRGDLPVGGGRGGN